MFCTLPLPPALEKLHKVRGLVSSEYSSQVRTMLLCESEELNWTTVYCNLQPPVHRFFFLETSNLNQMVNSGVCSRNIRDCRSATLEINYSQGSQTETYMPASSLKLEWSRLMKSQGNFSKGQLCEGFLVTHYLWFRMPTILFLNAGICIAHNVC